MRALQPFTLAVVRGDALECIRLLGDADYILVPQMLGEALPYVYQPYLIGAPDAPVLSSIAASALSASDQESTAEGAQRTLHDLVRREERRLRAPVRRAMRLEAAADAPASRDFSVLASLAEPLRFASVKAALRYEGARVLLYMDERTAAAYPENELTALGKLYDEVLYAVDHDWFGAESDIDGNGRVIVLMTPAVNALVTAAECATIGFATGFFYGFDLAGAAPESNRGEIFYAMTPDPDGAYSCAHSSADVEQILPATFVHELQHMISYGYRVLGNGVEPEVPWLNEGLSHIAEELGSVHYESRYPAPSGRTRPEQLFPDSAGPLIIGNLFNSYRFLRFSQQYSVVSCAPGSFCYTAERGGAWLFLRWLADATGDAKLFEKLVQSGLRDRQNIEAATGATFADHFAEFAMAVWADSIVAYPRASVSPRLRFTTRNLRQLYSALYDAYGPLGGVPQRFPLSATDLDANTRVKAAMRPGTLQAFRIRAATGRAEIALSYTADGGLPLRTDQGAQLSIMRVPTP